MNEQNQQPVRVFGHRHPDTDSVCAAITYSHLKNQIDPSRVYEPCRAGLLSRETRFVLEHFDVQPPQICLDVRPQIKDVGFRTVTGVDADISLRQAWLTMRNDHVDTLCITDKSGKLEGIITSNDMTGASMDMLDAYILAKSQTSYQNIVETLNGTVAAGDITGKTVTGHIVIGAGSSELMEKHVGSGDIVIVSNRVDSQLSAIESHAGCIIVCGGFTVSHTICMLAEEQGCVVITTAQDTFAVSQLIVQATPVRYYMNSKNLLTFTPESPVEEATKVMATVRFHYFPILDDDGHCLGMVSRRNMLSLKKKQLILVDHNERTQAVDGLNTAVVLEVIDHHRIGTLETDLPVYFRNEPVGCTCTIIYQMYLENGVAIDRAMAGLMLSAILSDTVMFRSPTCTEKDKQAANALAALCNEDLEQYAEAMFEAGSDVSGQSPDDILNTDYKEFDNGHVHFGITQVSYVSIQGRKDCEKLVAPHIQSFFEKKRLDLLFCMFTHIPTTSSDVLMAGKGAEDLIRKAFQIKIKDGMAVLPGVISRKKQMVPTLLNALNQAAEQ